MGARRTLVIAGALTVVAAVVVAGLVLTRPSGDRNPGDGPTASPSPSPADAQAEVEQAYLAYWKARTAALLNLDPAPLEQVATGEALAATRRLVQEQAAKNQPVRVRVEHRYRIVMVSEDLATVDDALISHSVRLDPITREPIEPDPNLPLRNSYTLKKVGGRWKVAEIIGVEESPSPA